MDQFIILISKTGHMLTSNFIDFIRMNHVKIHFPEQKKFKKGKEKPSPIVLSEWTRHDNLLSQTMGTILP